LEAAGALPPAYLRAVFDSDNARAWPMVRLGDALVLRKDVVHPYDNPSGRATFVGLEHVESVIGTRLGAMEVEMALLTGRKPRFFQDDVVYGYLRPYLNKVWVADFDGLCSVDQYVYAVRTERALPHFVAWFMRSPTFLARAPIATTPGQLPRIRTEEVFSVEIGLPSIVEQERVVAQVAAAMKLASDARRGIEEQLAALDGLKAGCLRTAFGGEL
jgi:type I restriction enzyme, S subunit